MNYQPFPIADFRTGEFTAREAWLSPPDAFQTMENANIEYGVIKKRPGYRVFGYFPTSLGAVTSVTASGSGTEVSVELTGHGLSTGDAVYFRSVTTTTELNGNRYFITKTDANNFTLDNTDQANFTDGGSGGICEHLKNLSKKGEISAVGISQTNPAIVTTGSAHGLSDGNTVLITGDFANAIAGMTELANYVSTINVTSTTTFKLNDVDTSDFTAHTTGGDVALISTGNNNQIVGIGQLFQDETENKLLAINQRRLAQYNTTTEAFESVSTSDDFTSTGSDYFQFTNAFNYVWMTNFKDNVHRYDGTTLETPAFDIDGDGGASPTFGSHNDLTRCKFIFQFNRRLILLYTVESSTKYPQRVRWSRTDFGAGSTSQWDDTAADTTAGSLDADTDEEIITAQFLGDNLIVFFERSIWALRKTGSFDIPFRWEKLSEAPGVFSSRFGIVQHENFLWAFGSGGIVATDGVQTKRIDDVIPQFENTVEASNLKRVFMSKLIDVREVWLSYSTIDDTLNNRVKVLDYENGTYADFTIPYSVIGAFNIENVAETTWADITDESWAEIFELTWNDFGSKPGKPRNYTGDNTGIIYQQRDGTRDAGKIIPVNLLSARMNPFKDQGKSARLGYVDFLLNESASSSVELDFYTDFDSKPHTTVTISLKNDEGNDELTKIWKRAYVDVIGNSHRIGIRQNLSVGPLAVHAIVPYFSPSGRFLNL